MFNNKIEEIHFNLRYLENHLKLFATITQLTPIYIYTIDNFLVYYYFYEK